MDNIYKEIQKGMDVPNFAFKARETGEQLVVSVSNGSVEMTVWPARDSGDRKPVFKQRLTPEGAVMFREMLQKTLQYGPGSRNSLLFSEWNRDANKMDAKASFIALRDDKQCVAFEIQFQFNGNNKVIQFNVACSDTIKPSGVEFQWKEKSEYKTKALIEWMAAIAPLACLFTKGTWSPRGGGQGGNNQGGGGNAY